MTVKSPQLSAATVAGCGEKNRNNTVVCKTCQTGKVQGGSDAVFSGDVGMPVRGNENGEARRSKQSRYELPRR
jgi:hypothetical protein